MTDEEAARAIFEAAIAEHRCDELLTALFDGGSATVDRRTGELVVINGAQLRGMING